MQEMAKLVGKEEPLSRGELTTRITRVGKDAGCSLIGIYSQSCSADILQLDIRDAHTQSLEMFLYINGPVSLVANAGPLGPFLGQPVTIAPG
jgi:hypothetical protein